MMSPAARKRPASQPSRTIGFVVDDLSLHDWSACPRSTRIVAPIPPKYAVPGSTVFVGHAVAKEIRLLYTATLMSITDVDLQFDDVTTLSTPYILDRKRSHKHWFQFQESDVQEQCTLTAFGIGAKAKTRRSDDTVLAAAATARAAATAALAHDDGTDIATGVAADAQADHDPHVDETDETVKKVSAADAEQADAANATPRSKVDEIVEGTVAAADAEQPAAANAAFCDTAEEMVDDAVAAAAGEAEQADAVKAGCAVPVVNTMAELVADEPDEPLSYDQSQSAGPRDPQHDLAPAGVATQDVVDANPAPLPVPSGPPESLSLPRVAPPTPTPTSSADTPGTCTPQNNFFRASSTEQCVYLDESDNEPVPDRPSYLHAGVAGALTVQDLFDWADFALDVVNKQLGDGSIPKLLDAICCTSYSTAFSGVDAPGTGAGVMCRRLGVRLGCSSTPSMQHLSAIEWDAQARQELLCHPTPPLCCFGDIDQFYTDAVRDVLDRASRQGHVSIDALVPTILDSRGVRLDAPCSRHTKRREAREALCTLKRAKLHIAGFPCIDWSRLGLLQKSSGSSARYFCAWIMLRRRLKEPLLLLENVDGFDTSIIRTLLEDLYMIDEMTVCSTSFGWPCRRLRKYIVCLLKTTVTLIGTARLSNTIPLFFRQCTISFQSLLVADSEELEAELKWSRGRQLSRSHNVPLPSTSTWAQDVNVFRDALTATEQERLAQYTSKFGATRCMMLAQNPLTRPILSPSAEVLNTIVKHVRLLWVPSLRQPRWWTATELLLTQGFPCTTRVLSKGNEADVQCTSFGQPRRRSVLQMRAQAGNTMNVNVVGVFLIFLLSFTNRSDVSPLHAAMARARQRDS